LKILKYLQTCYLEHLYPMDRLLSSDIEIYCDRDHISDWILVFNMTSSTMKIKHVFLTVLSWVNLNKWRLV